MDKLILGFLLIALPCCAGPRGAANYNSASPAGNAASPAGSFEACVQAGYEIIRSHPMRCVTPQGMVFLKDQPVRNNRGGLCKDMCGDGVCQQIVCQGENCPCAETPIVCPGDCIAG